MNDKEFLFKNQGAVNNMSPETTNSYADLDFGTLNTENYQESTEVYDASVSEVSVNPFSSEVEAPDFGANIQEEAVEALPDFFNQEDDSIFLDSEGVFHNESAGELGGTEATGVSKGNFAGDSIASQEEINSLIGDVMNDADLEVDQFGTIRNASSNSGLRGTEATGVSQGGFAGDSIASQEEINSLIGDVMNDADLEVDQFGTIRNASSNSGLRGTEATGVSQGGFAAQWYEQNKKLFDAEVRLMKQRFPDAKYGFFESNKNMYWILKMNISKTDAFEPWTFLLVYMPDHPNNTGYGGSIKVIPLSPKFDQLSSRVKESKGQYFTETPPVPHVVNKDGTRYLCTRASADIEDGNAAITTAVQVAAWAAEWALYFELSMRDNRVWNKWVDDDHFRKWKIT